MTTFSSIETLLTLNQSLPSTRVSYPVNLRLRNLDHILYDRNPVDPATFAARLEAAGFSGMRVTRAGSGFAWRGRKT